MCTLIRFSVTDQGGWYHQTRRIFLLYFSTSSPSSVPSLINYCSQPVACCFQHAGVLYLTDTAIFTRPCHHVPYYERAYDSEEIDVNRNCFGGVCPAAAGRPGSAPVAVTPNRRRDIVVLFLSRCVHVHAQSACRLASVQCSDCCMLRNFLFYIVSQSFLFFFFVLLSVLFLDSN